MGGLREGQVWVKGPTVLPLLPDWADADPGGTWKGLAARWVTWATVSGPCHTVPGLASSHTREASVLLKAT